MSRYDPGSLRDAIALTTALVAEEDTTFVHLAKECADDRAETTIASLAYVARTMAYNIVRLYRTDLTPEEQAKLTNDDLRATALELLSMYGTSFAQQLEDRGSGDDR